MKQPTDWKIAVFAGGAGLIGALVGGLITLMGTVIQVNHDSAQAEADFLRGQRQVTYSQVLKDINSAYGAESKWFDAFYSNVHDHPGSSISSTILDSAPIHKSLETLHADLTNIGIIGSEQASNAGESEYSVLLTRLAVIDTTISGLKGDGDPTVELEALQSSINDLRNSPDAQSVQRLSFAQAAKRDLGVQN